MGKENRSRKNRPKDKTKAPSRPALEDDEDAGAAEANQSGSLSEMAVSSNARDR